MGQSYRIRTELGINKTINVQLDQEFEFLEILSLKIQQEDIYNRSCADYGLIVGRVTANNGFGIPNARVSIFIPIDSIDESNPIISSIYPYKSPTDINEDGYRYNLLPYEKSYSTHAATGTLPSRLDVLTGSTAIEIYDKYYKFTAKTNISGDYMIMGVPVGQQDLVMDVDLSDIGEFSLTPQDLIRMGLATESQVAGNRFKTSNDLNSLPQIINIVKNIEVSPLWGEPDLCQIAVNRLDFDLRETANVDIQPTATFMGSIFSSPDSMRVRPMYSIPIIGTIGGRPKDNLGNLCGLISGPGQIIAIRQTINQDSDGNPVLETYQLEQAGNIIDGDGTWLTELPMNLEYYTTNEFGENVISNDPAIGIPTKGKYRFKVKWQQASDLSQQVRRPYFLVPNVKEYGWNASNSDPYLYGSTINKEKLQSSYYFGLAWSGYTNGFSKTSGNEYYDRINEIVNCEDTFYQFHYNRVYTVAQLIDEYKKGGRARFIGIKEIDSSDCDTTVNKFPVNEGFKNFDLLYFLFSFILQIIQLIGVPLIYIIRFVLYLYYTVLTFLCNLCDIEVLGKKIFQFICDGLNIQCPVDTSTVNMSLPMLTYPECSTCECKTTVTTQQTQQVQQPAQVLPNGSLSYFSSPPLYETAFQYHYSPQGQQGNDLVAISLASAQAMGGVSDQVFLSDPTRYKIPVSDVVTMTSPPTFNNLGAISQNLPLGERINIFNQRNNFFTGLNKIKVCFSSDVNGGITGSKFHYDNTITVVSNSSYASGQLLSFVSTQNSSDLNYKYSAVTLNGNIYGVSGTSYNSSSSPTTVNVSYATGQYVNSTPVTYNLAYGSDITTNSFAADVEYFQVLTAITISQLQSIWNTGTTQSFPNVLNQPSVIQTWDLDNQTPYQSESFNPLEYFEGYTDLYVLILQRGVDPYSPKYMNEYGIGKLLGLANEEDFIINVETRLNIPIQALSGTYPITVQSFSNQDEIYYQSYFFRPGIVGSTTYGFEYTAYTTNQLGYYGSLDATNYNPTYMGLLGDTVVSKTSNGFYLTTPNSATYDSSEDVSGLGIMNMGIPPVTTPVATINYPYPSFDTYYYTKAFGPTFTLTISNPVKNVMRTDRLPTSDILDGDWTVNPSILQQNLQFAIYLVGDSGTSTSTTPYGGGANQVSPDIGGLPGSIGVLESFSCEKMVSLKCYQGFGTNFQVNQTCATLDPVERGCYILFRNPLDLSLVNEDLETWAEWGFRFRFMYALCRGVLSQTFTNNWINGTLFAFPVQVNVFYDQQNKPLPPDVPYELVYFDADTTNFYFRSSPYSDITNKFIGRTTDDTAVNERNLMFPTTLIDMGYKDYFYSEITFDPATNAYVIPSINPTSYGDTSDLVNLFVISRITDTKFLDNIINAGNNSPQTLFSRPDGNTGPFTWFNPKSRVDGDFAQLCSINSEIGNINFSPEYYETKPVNSPTNILGSPGDPIMAVWFSSTTQDLQTKDYLTPGRINFRTANNAGYFPFPFGIKSQVVPHYQWRLENTDTIFGNQLNTWATGETDIVQSKPYQSLDRTYLGTPSYFRPLTSSVSDLYARGYIFSVDANGVYSQIGASSQQFIVGAPFHFYFGINKGNSALDKFKTKYSVLE